MRLSFVFLLPLLALPLSAQQGDDKNARMEPVVPGKMIPPSPVLPVDEALKSFRIAPGFVIEAVAAEPLVEMPVCLDFDPRGRMWVCEMRGFMPDVDGAGEEIPEGRIVILEDADHDGRVDKRTVFLDKLLLPRSIAVFGDGVLFIEETRLCWVARDGDRPSGEPREIDSKLLANGNVEHKPNGLLPGLDNRYYLAKSDKRLRRDGGDWVIDPSQARGQWGIARDDFGRLYYNNNSTLLFGDLLAPGLLQGNPGVKMRPKEFTQLGGNEVWPVRVTPAVNRAYLSQANGYDGNILDPRTHRLINATAAAGMTIYRGTNFPREWYGTAFTTEPAGNLVKAIRIAEKDGALTGSHPLGESEFLASTDERFRPVNACTAPDGSLYLLDLYHGIIQHKTYMTTYLRKQSESRGLDRPAAGLGRIYRVRSVGGRLEPAMNLAELQGLELVKMLMHPNAWQREMAQRLLVERRDPETVPFLAKLADRGEAIARIHAIWSLEGMGSLKAEHLVAALQSADAKLQCSALWASTRLAVEELKKLEPVLLKMKPAGPEVEPYLARALGPLGSGKAYARIAGLLDSAGKARFVREAAVSGLDGHESEFLVAEMKGSHDKELAGWLEQGIGDVSEEKSGKSGLAGPALESFQRGKALFHGEAACFGCHGADGAGLPNLGPPLDGSEWVTGRPEALAKILLHGMTGPVSVAGEAYTPAADMPGLAANPAFTDQDIADIASYIRNEWGNAAAPVAAELVARQRELAKDRSARPWTQKELGEQ